MTIGLVGMARPEGVKCLRRSSGSERTERQSSQGGRIECSVT